MASISGSVLRLLAFAAARVFPLFAIGIQSTLMFEERTTAPHLSISDLI